MRIFKTGDKVRLISNEADSCNPVGSIGIVGRVRIYDDFINSFKNNKGHCRVHVKGVIDYGNESYFSDLELIPKELNNNIKIL